METDTRMAQMLTLAEVLKAAIVTILKNKNRLQRMYALK